MIIIRDGKEYVLTLSELERAYRERLHLYLRDDALRQLDEFIELTYPQMADFEKTFGFTYEQITTPTSARYLVDKFVAAYQNAGDCNEAENDTWQNVIRTILMRNAETIKHTYSATYRIWTVTKTGMKSHLSLVTSLHPKPYESKEALHEDAHGYLEKVLNRHCICNGEVLIRTEIRHNITVGDEQTGLRDWTMEVSGWDRTGMMNEGKLSFPLFANE